MITKTSLLLYDMFILIKKSPFFRTPSVQGPNVMPFAPEFQLIYVFP